MILVEFLNSGSTKLNCGFDVDVALSADADFGSAIDFVFMAVDFTHVQQSHGLKHISTTEAFRKITLGAMDNQTEHAL